jgi:hypothetical protein
LLELTKQGVPWIWNNNHYKAFDAIIKAAISKDCMRAYYNPQQDTQLIVRASPYGLGAILSNVDYFQRLFVTLLCSNGLTCILPDKITRHAIACPLPN